MDGLSVAASIIAVVQIAGSVIIPGRCQGRSERVRKVPDRGV